MEPRIFILASDSIFMEAIVSLGAWDQTVGVMSKPRIKSERCSTAHFQQGILYRTNKKSYFPLTS